jgi:hypothetical protein
VIRLDADRVEALKRHRDARVAERDAAADAYIDRDLIFCNELGESLHPWSITRPFAKVRKSAGIRPGRLHDVREWSRHASAQSGRARTHRLGETRPPLADDHLERRRAHAADVRRAGSRGHGGGARLAIGLQNRL